MKIEAESTPPIDLQSAVLANVPCTCSPGYNVDPGRHLAACQYARVQAAFDDYGPLSAPKTSEQTHEWYDTTRCKKCDIVYTRGEGMDICSGEDSGSRALTQLGGCLLAAEGCATGTNNIEKGDYGWSPAFQAVKELWNESEGLANTLRKMRGDAQVRERRMRNLDGSLGIAVERNQKLRRDLEKAFGTIEELRKQRETKAKQTSVRTTKLAEENMDCHNQIETLQKTAWADADAVVKLSAENKRLRDASPVKALAAEQTNLLTKIESLEKASANEKIDYCAHVKTINMLVDQKEDLRCERDSAYKTLEAERVANADKVQIIEGQCRERRTIKEAVERNDMAGLRNILNPPESDEPESAKKTETEIRTIVLDAGPDHLNIVEIANVTALRAERDRLRKKCRNAHALIIKHVPCTCTPENSKAFSHAPTCPTEIALKEFAESP